MTVTLIAPKTKPNFVNAGFHGLLAVLEAINPTGPNIPNVLSNLKSGFSSLVGQPEDSVESRAWVWAFKTLSYATAELLKTERLKAPLSPQKDEAVKEFLNAAVDFTGHSLDGVTLLNPGLSPLFRSAHAALKPLVLRATTGHQLDIDTLTERFNQALRTGSNRTLCEDPNYYSPLEDALNGIAGEGARRDGSWARHSHWISYQFTDAPIFSPDEDQIIPLEAVYLPLRCFWHETELIKNDDGSNALYKTAHVSHLHTEMHEWLDADAKKDPIRVVTGGPGSGKSSFARAFAHEVIQTGRHRVVFVRLQFTNLTGSLQDDIARYIRQHDNAVAEHGNPGLPGNPFEWRKTDTTPMLLIFDGLDELSTNEVEGDRYARDFLLALKLMLSPWNSDGSPVRAMVLGRNLACQSAMQAANVPLQTMLNVAPIAKMDRSTCMLAYSSEDEDIKDPKGLMKCDQRKDYWERWADLKGLETKGVPEAITARSMEELNVEPLLLHLLVNSRFCGEDWKLAAQNKNVVYEDILRKIFDRNKKKDHFQSVGVDEPLFFALMECLGIAAWRGNGRTGDEDDFRAVRKLHLNKEKTFKQFHAASLKSVALNIHTRAGEDDASGGFEFIHKSFGEYLAARGLLSYALKTARMLDTVEPEDIERHWCQLIGVADLSEEIVNFLYDEVRLTLKPDPAIQAKEALTELLNWIVKNGFSVHKSSPEAAWSELEQRQQCAASSLVAATSAVTTAIPMGQWDSGDSTNWCIDIEFPNGEASARALLEKLGVTTERPIQCALQRMKFSRRSLWDTNLSRANLNGSDFKGVNLIWGLFFGASLENARFDDADLAHTQFADANAKNAQMKRVNLKSASITSSDFTGCDLTDACLEDVVATREPKLGLFNRYTGKTVEASIDLKGAILTRADLSGANLAGAINLSLEAVNSAVGDKRTILPDYIDRSKVVWLEDA